MLHRLHCATMSASRLPSRAQLPATYHSLRYLIKQKHNERAHICERIRLITSNSDIECKHIDDMRSRSRLPIHSHEYISHLQTTVFKRDVNNYNKHHTSNERDVRHLKNIQHCNVLVSRLQSTRHSDHRSVSQTSDS